MGFQRKKKIMAVYKFVTLYIFSFFLDKNFIYSSSRAKFVEEVKDLSFIIEKHTHLKNKNIFKTPVKSVLNDEL